MSDKNRLDKVPVCKHCGHKMAFELQFMPMLFDYQPILRTVDWDVIAVYTCTNVEKCLPSFAQDQYFVEEFAYVQFCKDFEQVQYGTPEQVAAQRKAKEAALVADLREDDPDILEAKRLEEDKAKKNAEKNKRKKEKKKAKLAEQKLKSESVNAQVQSELSDLM
jgi:hypothetical protein